MNIGAPIQTAEIEAAAAALRQAEAYRVGIAPLTEQFPHLSIDEAYAIQRANLGHRLAAGERIVGRKIGLTSLAMQRQLGVDQPDYGVITDVMEIPESGVFDPSLLLEPRVEAEFAFEIGTDLPASPSREELVGAISGVAVAMEVIDSRISDWRIKLLDTVADNASMARVVWGAFVSATPELLANLPGVLLTLSRDGEQTCSGPGSAVLGDPLTSLHWLAGALGAHGDTFRAGDRVLAGAVAAAVDLVPHAEWTVHADGFPSATFRTAAVNHSEL